MRVSRSGAPSVWIVLVAVALVTMVAGVAVRTQAPAIVEKMPPISWSCPMHPEIVEPQKGACPICKMDLEPVRLDTVWSCPVHSVVSQSTGGKCPICRRELAQTTVALTFTCENAPDVNAIDPGTCADGSARIPKHSARAHGNHSPQHGGGFFMAADNWHHVEGTYPEEGVFRLFLYDDYTKPLPADKTAQVAGRVVTKSEFDTATMTEKEVATSPLTRIENAPYFEAKVDRLVPPVDLSIKVKFTADGPESRFDFTFTEFSKDPVGTAITTAAVDPSQLMVEIPNDPKSVIAMLQTRHSQIERFIKERAFAQVYVPALQAKDLALALDVQAETLPPARRGLVSPAVIQVVRASWMLDAYGDMGNREQIETAYAAFATAVAKLIAAFESPSSAPPQR